MDIDLRGIVGPHAFDTAEHICPICGKVVPKQTYTIRGREVKVQPICQCEAKEDERQIREIEQRQRKREIESRYSSLKNSPKYRECSFNNFEVADDNRAAYIAAQQFVSLWPASNNLLLFGDPGNGKSHLAAAIGNALQSDEVIVVFVAYVDLLERIKSTYNGGDSSEAEIMGAVCGADLLILDDLGVEKPSEFTLDVLFRITERRGKNFKRTVYTSNYSPPDLVARYVKAVGKVEAQRVIGRVIEDTNVVENKGEDRRFAG